jgi:hypothetical protein
VKAIGTSFYWFSWRTISEYSLAKKSLGTATWGVLIYGVAMGAKKGTLNQVTAYPAPTKGLPRTATGQRPLRDAAQMPASWNTRLHIRDLLVLQQHNPFGRLPDDEPHQAEEQGYVMPVLAEGLRFGPEYV